MKAAFSGGPDEDDYYSSYEVMHNKAEIWCCVLVVQSDRVFAVHARMRARSNSLLKSFFPGLALPAWPGFAWPGLARKAPWLVMAALKARLRAGSIYTAELSPNPVFCDCHSLSDHRGDQALLSGRTGSQRGPLAFSWKY